MWFGFPFSWMPWPKRWRKLYIVWSHKSVRFIGYVEGYYDYPIPMFGFWFFHICLDYDR